MFPRYDLLAKLERQWARETPIDRQANLRQLDDLVALAVALGVWPPQDPFDDMEHKSAIQRTLNLARRDEGRREKTG